MASHYYIWKWADNNLNGRPPEIVAHLCAGEMPEMLQAFKPQRVLKRLDEVAAKRRSQTGELLIQSQEEQGGRVRFIHLCDPASGSDWLTNKLLWAVWDAHLTLYDESTNRLLGLPKRNVVEVCWGEQLVDIEASEIPALLRRLGSRHGLGALACYDKNGNMFQIWAHRRRFAVEWQLLPDRDFKRHQIWIAGRQRKSRAKVILGPPNRCMKLFAHETLNIDEVQRLWESFLKSKRRPTGYSWRDITEDLKTPGDPPRHRHEIRAEEPPP
jgi:hypothetical protein